MVEYLVSVDGGKGSGRGWAPGCFRNQESVFIVRFFRVSPYWILIPDEDTIRKYIDVAHSLRDNLSILCSGRHVSYDHIE